MSMFMLGLELKRATTLGLGRLSASVCTYVHMIMLPRSMKDIQVIRGCILFVPASQQYIRVSGILGVCEVYVVY